MAQIDRIIKILLIFAYINLPILIEAANIDTTFIRNLEKEYRNNYRNCTGDTTNQPLAKILLWKQSFDSITRSQKFGALEKQYSDENHLEKTKPSPCEIVLWSKNKDQKKREIDSLAVESNKIEKQWKIDSLTIAREIGNSRKTTCDYANIPFGISKKSLITLAERAGVRQLKDDGDCLYFSNHNDSIFSTIAFYFDTNDVYKKYAIESSSLPLDSLDTFIRGYAEKLATFFQKKIGNKAPQTNYIGRFDIVENSLSIYKQWKLDTITVYIGLATFNNRFYAKAIVTSNK